MRFSLQAPEGVIDCHATEAYSSLDLTRVQYRFRMLCIDQEEKVTVRINPKQPVSGEKKFIFLFGEEEALYL